MDTNEYIKRIPYNDILTAAKFCSMKNINRDEEVCSQCYCPLAERRDCKKVLRDGLENILTYLDITEANAEWKKTDSDISSNASTE